jgi:glucosamine--fructose-6-phosphate aminotransferase (isomerizing)
VTYSWLKKSSEEAPFGSGTAAELREAAAAVERQLVELATPLAKFVASLVHRSPKFAMTCARGSSAHAATFAKHSIERYMGIPVAAAAPNIATIYHRELCLKDQLFLTISQSGSSDDLIETAAAARAAGALTAVVVNDPKSPLASICEFVLPMAAGPELNVAATKTFVASLAAILRLTALWGGKDEISSACDRLPGRLIEASELDWSPALPTLAAADSCLVIGRGPTLAIAREVALKLKEMCSMHAEAFSSAELRHGPIALVSSKYPVILLPPTDESAHGFADLVADLREKSACVLVAEYGDRQFGSLPALLPDHPEADAICLIQSFYGLLVRLAAERGIDADHPRHLQKVTRTR